ncbi:MAG: hypothetical protein AB1467_05910 [Candidatus Diapherotrites archaeon]
MNSKGQEFSVFKLLISAVIAVVILTLLLNILGLIGPIGQGDPKKESVEILKQAYNNRYNDYRTKAVTFSNNDQINVKATAEASGLITADQLCMVGESSFGPPNWTITAKSIMYTGGGQKQAYLAAYCDKGNALSTSLEDTSFLKDVDVSGCNCATPDNTDTCCIVGLVK